MAEHSKDPDPGPLADLRVLDCSTILAGPLCCQILGDFGADVVKIEHPSIPDGMRSHGAQKDGVPLWWKEVGRNKRAITLNLGTAPGAEVFCRLADTADVLVENFRPGTLERWDLAIERLHRSNPGLVVVRLTGWGQTGPYARRPGFGTLAEAMSGFAHLTGDADGPPTLPAFGLADSICGIAASSAALMALHHREQSGRGQVVDISILEPIMTAVGPTATVYDQLGVIERRHGNRSTNNAPRNTYQTSDRSWVAVSSSAQAVAERVVRLIGHPEFVTEPWFASGRGRAEHADLLDDLLGKWVAERSQREVLDAFAAAGAAIAPVYDARDLVADPQVQALKMLVRVPDEELGDVLLHNVMWRLSETPGRIRFTGRAHGADTETVLTELGYDDLEIDRLRAAGAIK